jgi:hypothetical protein
MRPPIYRFTFDRAVPMDDVEEALVLALLVVQILHGDARTRLAVGHAFDRKRRVCVIDATTAEGKDLSKLLVGFLAREFGADAFTVRPTRPRSADPRAPHPTPSPGSRT